MEYSILGLTPNASFEEIKHNWRELCKIYHPDNLETGDADRFRQINDAYKRITDKINSKTIPNEEQTIDYRGILDDYIKCAYEKYNDIETICSYIYAYMKGHINAITRDENYRELFQKYISPEIIETLTDGDLKNYVNRLIKTYNPAYETFMAASKATYIKYGKHQLITALNQAIKGDYSFFTNDGKKLRDKMKTKVSPSDIYGYLVSILNGKDFSKSTLGAVVADDLIIMLRAYHNYKKHL